MADSAPAILQVEVKSAARLEPARSVGVAPGMARLYVEARPVAALTGVGPGVPLVRYLVDVPLDARGKVANLKKQMALIFVRPTATEGELQLLAPDAQWAWSPELDARVRGVLAELARPGAPGRITGVSVALYQPGNLAGEGETQFFLNTASGVPASITVRHAPGAAPTWNASFSEVVDASGKPPAHDSLPWYRLACSLPARLPAKANVGENQPERDQAIADYAMVLRDLGPCAHGG
ncbi:MAG TPA: hypothetical protein VN222_13835 [Novosphingobium sp.]|nr:hypothetical protein [Novosphingobium sp.]